MSIILNGKKIAKEIIKNIKKKTKKIKIKNKNTPTLTIILIENNLPSLKYIKNKIKTCKITKFNYKIIKYNKINKKRILKLIKENNLNKKIDGLIIQLPLPKNINLKKITNKIKIEKDVDGLNLLNHGKMIHKLPMYIPATPMGILELLKIYKIETKSKNCVIIGKNHIIGIPLGILMSKNNYPGNSTVTICDELTKNISYFTNNADILIVATGKKNLIKKNMVKEKSVVIDVGITYVKKKNKIKGDVNFKKILKKCSYITPVPGGIGPMTIASLFLNIFKAYIKNI